MSTNIPVGCKPILPNQMLHDIQRFERYVEELKDRLYPGDSWGTIIEKAPKEHRAFRLLPLILMVQYQGGSIYIPHIPILKRAATALAVFLTSSHVGDAAYKESLILHVDGPLGETDETLQLLDVENVWKDLCTFRLLLWKEAKREGKLTDKSINV